MTNPARPIALVTGASSGIGAHLARELARDGHDLVLVARRTGPMQSLADECKADGANTTILATDLSKEGAVRSLVREIEARQLAIEVLINAAGLGDNGRFDRSDPDRIGEMLQVNVVTLTELTRLLLPGMVERGRGKVMLVASTAAFQPGPQMAVYCASKAYVLNLGKAIAYELRHSGVTVTTLCPGPTATEFAQVAKADGSPLFKSSLMPVMQAAEVARIGYKGLKAGRPVIIAGAFNALMAISGQFSPAPVSLAVGKYLMSQPGSA